MKYLKNINEEINNKEITILSTDDWEGLYHNGELLDEGHSINFYSILRKLGYHIEYISVDDPEEFENYFGTNCPDTLDEVKMKLDVKKYNL